MWYKTKLAGAECHSSTVIGIDTATGDHVTAALIQRVCQKELHHSNLEKDMATMNNTEIKTFYNNLMDITHR